MRTEKYVREKRIRDLMNETEVEQGINDLIRQMFSDMMRMNLIAEGETLFFEIHKEIDKNEMDPLHQYNRKAVIKIRCRMREATSRGYVPEAIYKNGRNTTVKWEDGTITTVKLAEGEEDSDYAAFTAALSIKALGTNQNIKKILDKKLIIQKKKKGEAKDD